MLKKQEKYNISVVLTYYTSVRLKLHKYNSNRNHNLWLWTRKIVTSVTAS